MVIYIDIHYIQYTLIYINSDIIMLTQLVSLYIPSYVLIRASFFTICFLNLSIVEKIIMLVLLAFESEDLTLDY